MFGWYQAFLKTCENAAKISENCDRLDELESIHPHQIPDHNHQVLRCTGPFTYVSNPTGRLSITTGTQMFGNNVDGEVLPWTSIGSSTTSPDCVTDVKAWWDPGDIIVYGRRVRVYLWLDVRLLSGTTPLYTYGTRRYLYRDERNDTNPDVIEPLQYEMEDFGNAKYMRPNVAPGTVLDLQIRIRGRMAAAQASSWVRVYGPYRAQAGFDSWPREIAVDFV